MNTKLPSAQATTADQLQEMARLIIQKQEEAGVTFSKNEKGRRLDTPKIGQNSPGTPSEADADEDTYEGIRVVVKPLDRRGNSGEREYEISSQSSQWRAVEIPGEFRPDRILDTKYTTSNSMTIPCGEGWNSANSKKNQDANWASYAVVVDQIYDMHMNYLNPIAKTVAMRRPASLSDPIIVVQNPPDEVFVPKEKRCSTSNKNLCRDYGASCEVTEPVNGAGKDLCRWAKANTANKCNKTVGIWTTAQSKYSRNHPNAVPRGASGACITQAENIKNGIN